MPAPDRRLTTRASPPATRSSSSRDPAVVGNHLERRRAGVSDLGRKDHGLTAWREYRRAVDGRTPVKGNDQNGETQ